MARGTRPCGRSPAFRACRFRPARAATPIKATVFRHDATTPRATQLVIAVDNYSAQARTFVRLYQTHTKLQDGEAPRLLTGPASGARYDRDPNVRYPVSPSDRTAHSTPHGAPPPRPAPRRRSYPPDTSTAGPGKVFGRSSGRTLPRAIARTPVPAPAHSPTMSRRSATMRSSCAVLTPRDSAMELSSSELASFCPRSTSDR